MKIKISAEAESDLADGFWFYEDQQPGLGAEFRISVKTYIRSLELHGGTQASSMGIIEKFVDVFRSRSFIEWIQQRN